MRALKYIAFHPVRTLITVLAGGVLGMAAFYVVQIQALFDTVAVEEFDPQSAQSALDVTTTSIRRLVLVASVDGEATQSADPVEWHGGTADFLRDLYETPFDPREFSPYSFGEDFPDSEFTSYLLIGTDASGARADSIILTLQPNSGAPIMVSLPRDLYVWNSCRNTFTRLNAGLGGCAGVASGSEMLAILVEEYTGIDIDHLARINFSGFAAVVDAMGGTTICVDNPTRDIKSHLDIPEAGCHQADGAMTLAWVRSRSAEELVGEEWVKVGGSDFTRQARQQDVLFQLAAQAAGFSSPASLTTKLSAVASSVRLDSGWTFGDAVATGWKYRGISKGSVRRFSIAVRDYRTPSGARVLLPTAYFRDRLAKVY